MTLYIDEHLRRRIASALEEDRGTGDITAAACVPSSLAGHARVVAKSGGILCGTSVFSTVFQLVDSDITLAWHKNDADPVQAGEVCVVIDGRLTSILEAERTALNFLQHLSGIATLTSQFVARVKHTRARILDTRKTTPLWRDLQKYAVVTGGGNNHRRGLFDMFLIKENHIAAAGGITPAIQNAMDYRKKASIDALLEVEVSTLDQLEEALRFPVDRIMLDNMNVSEIRQAVLVVAGRCELEASGGITLDTVGPIAEAGIDFISVGALTHSVTAMDLSLLIE